MTRRQKDRSQRPRVWRDEDGDWVWACGCWVVGPIERDMPSAFASAERHASVHATFGFRTAA
jgi:hypothetical protein